MVHTTSKSAPTRRNYTTPQAADRPDLGSGHPEHLRAPDEPDAVSSIKAANRVFHSEWAHDEDEARHLVRVDG